MPYGKIVLDWKGRIKNDLGRYTWKHGRREIVEENVLDGVKAIFETTPAEIVTVHGFSFKTSDIPRDLARITRDGRLDVSDIFFTGTRRAPQGRWSHP